MRRALVWGVLWVGLVACDPGTVTEVVFIDRSGCLACHRPIQPDGSEAGIESAHPLVEDAELGCEVCHGGDPEARKQSEAHVLPPPGASKIVHNLTAAELDVVELDYLRFINPGDLRVAAQSCGDEACHQAIVDTVVTTQMATFSGELGVARYRAGLQSRGAGVKGIRDIQDPGFEGAPGTVEGLSAMEVPRIGADEDRVGPYQDLYLTKRCMNCHLWSFGDNAAPGNYRSSGCSACHMVYSDDGLSQTDDPHVDTTSPPHPRRHTLTRAVPTEQCVRCHHEGLRIGLSFQGVRERGAEGTEPEGIETLSEPLFGHEADFYVLDEDGSNDIDETPPDIHFEAGMHCIDCHTVREVHGDGRLYTDTENSVEIECEDCHGTADREATFFTRRGTKLEHLSRDEAGEVWLTSKVTGQRHPVSQIARLVGAATPESPLHQAMGRREDGFSHLDRLECATCHSAWVPTCYGCHVTVDMQQVERSQLNGQSTPGRVSEAVGPVRVDRLLLMLNTEGRVSPSMPAERLFLTAINGAGETLLDRAVRTGPDGSPGMGHRAVSPHTIRARSPFQSCDRCHPKTDGSNRDALQHVLGFGSGDFIETDGAGQIWSLDQLLADDFTLQVLVGHDDPFESRPLTSEIIERMLSVEVD